MRSTAGGFFSKNCRKNRRNFFRKVPVTLFLTGTTEKASKRTRLLWTENKDVVFWNYNCENRQKMREKAWKVWENKWQKCNCWRGILQNHGKRGNFWIYRLKTDKNQTEKIKKSLPNSNGCLVPSSSSVPMSAVYHYMPNNTFSRSQTNSCTCFSVLVPNSATIGDEASVVSKLNHGIT